MYDPSQNVEDIFRIEEIKSELHALSNGRMMIGRKDAEAWHPAMERQFLENVLTFVRARAVTHRELVIGDGGG